MTFGAILSTSYTVWFHSLRRFGIPLFGIIYVFFLVSFDYLFQSSHLKQDNYSYWMTALWLSSILITGQPLFLLLLISIPPAIVAYLIFGTMWAAYLCGMIPLSIFFAYHYEDNFLIYRAKKKVEYDTQEKLTGEPLSRKGHVDRKCPGKVWARYTLDMVLGAISCFYIVELFFTAVIFEIS